MNEQLIDMSEFIKNERVCSSKTNTNYHTVYVVVMAEDCPAARRATPQRTHPPLRLRKKEQKFVNPTSSAPGVPLTLSADMETIARFTKKDTKMGTTGSMEDHFTACSTT